MSLWEEKQDLQQLVKKVLALDYIIKENRTQAALQELQQDMENDFFTVVVLGEFKRGKSTFINALLQKELLPTDVLPETATINALMYNDTPTVQVVMNDGREEKGEATQEYLQKFSARQEGNLANNVKYIKIGYPSDILKNKLVIVDTPGVDDINESRSEVTYRFIPKANAVIFLLDAKSPLKKTEKEFIDSKLLPLGLDTILFAANKYDAVDEEEEEDYLEDLRVRLGMAFKIGEKDAQLKKIQLYPLSAKWAMQGVLQNKPKLTAASGINELSEALRDMVFNGKVEQNKIAHYKRRLRDILDNLVREYDNTRALKNADIDSLKDAVKQIRQMIAEQADDKKLIAEYVDKEKKNIKAMVNKSLRFFHRHLEENVVESIEMYKGMDFKEYVERRVSRLMQREMETWVANYSPQVDLLLKNLEKELSRGLSYRFKQKVKIEATVNDNLQNISAYRFDVVADDVSQTNLKAGAIAAGGAGLMMLIGTPILMPFISMAAFPFLQRRMLENRLMEAKVKIIPDVQEQLANSVLKLQESLYSYIDTRAKAIAENTESGFEMLLENMRQQIEDQIAEKEKAGQNLRDDIDVLSRRIGELKEFMDKC
jgi:small GTP-binding protein